MHYGDGVSVLTGRASIERRIAEIYALFQSLDDRNHRDLDRLMSWCAEDIVYQVPFFSPPVRCDGKVAMRAFMDQLQGLFANIKYFVHHVHVDEQSGTAIVEAHSERTHVASDRHYRIRYVFVYRFVNGLIVELREYANPIDVAGIATPEVR